MLDKIFEFFSKKTDTDKKINKSVNKLQKNDIKSDNLKTPFMKRRSERKN